MRRLKLWFMLLLLSLGLPSPYPAIRGGAETKEEKEEREAREAEEEGEVDEDELPPKVKDILKKERKARRDAEKEARTARREAKEERDDLQGQLADLEAKVDAGSTPEPGKGEPNAEVDRLTKELAKRDEQIAELTEKVETSGKESKNAKLLAELRSPDYEIAPDMVDLVAEQLDSVDFGDDGKPIGVKDAVEELLEKRPSLKGSTNGEGGGSGVSSTSPAASRGRGGNKDMSLEEAKTLAKEDPAKFNEMVDKGEIPSSALGG